MAEKAVNDFATTLTAGINASTTTIPVASAAPAGLQSGEFRVRVDSELLLVTSGQGGLTWTATRGAEGTTAASHSDGAAVTHVLTDASLDLIVQQTIDANALATDAEVASAVAAHTGDASSAHAASAISVTPFSSIAATDVQAALVEIVAEAVGGGNASAKFEAVTLTATPTLDVASKTIATFEAATAMTTNVAATTANRPDGGVIFLAGRQATSGGPFTLSIDGSSVGIPTTAGEYWLAMIVAGDTDTYGGLFGLKLPLAESDVTNLVTDLAAKATTAALAAHEADTTSIHGIADTSVLATATSVATAVSTHEADTTSVHGITNTAALIVNPMTTTDDIIKGGASGAPARVAKGSNNTVWGVDGSGVLGYKADPSGGGGGPFTPPDAVASNLASISNPIGEANSSLTPTAGRLYLVRLYDFPSTALTKMFIDVSTGGTGATALANCWLGLYYVSGANLVLAGKTATDRASSWGSAGTKAETLTAEAAQSLTHGGSGEKVYGGLLIGTQSTTAFVLRRAGGGSDTGYNANLVVGTDPLRTARFGSGQTTLPATVAISGLTADLMPWFGVS